MSEILSGEILPLADMFEIAMRDDLGIITR
jgi:hypothetical protein